MTQPERMKKLCAATQGFVYAVTMTGTTGRTASVPGEVTSYLDSVTAASKLPVCAGFGIRSHEQVEQLRATWPASSSVRRWSRCWKADRIPAAFLRSLRSS